VYVARAALPEMKCDPYVRAADYNPTVRLVCHIMSNPPLTGAHITWDGAERSLRPSVRHGWPPGVKFDRDDEYLAYLRQVNASSW